MVIYRYSKIHMKPNGTFTSNPLQKKRAKIAVKAVGASKYAAAHNENLPVSSS